MLCGFYIEIWVYLGTGFFPTIPAFLLVYLTPPANKGICSKYAVNKLYYNAFKEILMPEVNYIEKLYIYIFKSFQYSFYIL